MKAIDRKLALGAGFFLLFLTLFATGAPAQTTAAIQGRVIGEDGKPLRGATILIERTDINGEYTVDTNKKGRYFHVVPTGTYNVTCKVNGETADRVNGIQARPGADPVSATTVDFDLAAMAKKRQAARAAAEAGRLTEAQQQGLSAEEKAELQKKVAERAKAMQKNKELNDAFNTAMQAKEVGNWDVAIENFTKAGEVDPEQHVIWAQLADTYTKKAEASTGAVRDEALEKGIETYSKVIIMKPEDPAYHNNFGLALARAGKMEEATAELSKAAELNPTNGGQYFYNLGAVMLNTGRNDEAGSAFKKAIEMDPNYANAHFQYGMYLLSKATMADDGSIKPPEGTSASLEKYLELAPSGPFAESAKGALASLSGTVETEYTSGN
jgi:tetratricopeptide (TPR) repeat protein